MTIDKEGDVSVMTHAEAMDSRLVYLLNPETPVEQKGLAVSQLKTLAEMLDSGGLTQGAGEKLPVAIPVLELKEGAVETLAETDLRDAALPLNKDGAEGVQLSLNLSEESRAKVEVLASAKGVSPDQFVQDLLIRGVERFEGSTEGMVAAMKAMLDGDIEGASADLEPGRTHTVGVESAEAVTEGKVVTEKTTFVGDNEASDEGSEGEGEEASSEEASEGESEDSSEDGASEAGGVEAPADEGSESD